MRERLMVLLTVVNVAVLAFTLAERRPVEAKSDALPVLRGSALEIVDTQGRVRASIGVLPTEKTADKQGIPETVLLRLMTERGRPAIKISTSEEGSGFMAAGPTGTSQTYVAVGSKGNTASMRIRNEDGTELTMAPR
jgi:hypothetical protein